MKNYWLDKRYPLATAVRDYRKAKDALTMQALERMFHDMALALLNTLKPTLRRGKVLDVMEEAAWGRVERFDLRKKPQAVNYFTGVMLGAAKDYLASQKTDAERQRVMALRRSAIRRAWAAKKGTP